MWFRRILCIVFGSILLLASGFMVLLYAGMVEHGPKQVSDLVIVIAAGFFAGALYYFSRLWTLGRPLIRFPRWPAANSNRHLRR